MGLRGTVASADAILHGVETRTSSPVQVVRGARDFESVSLRGLFPAGEGAGYAGGIVSAAVDGVRVAEQIALRVLAKQDKEAETEAVKARETTGGISGG